jgi:hypothetical protein
MSTTTACEICGRRSASSSKFCEIHSKAVQELEKKFPAWLRAYGTQLSRSDYLRKIISLPQSGDYIKEVARYLLDQRKKAVENMLHTSREA